MIPYTFSDWKNCIVNDCKIKLTKDFANERLAIYTNRQHIETKTFISLYGEQHHTNIVNWLEKIKND
jgi:hypothetical protein